MDAPLLHPRLRDLPLLVALTLSIGCSGEAARPHDAGSERGRVADAGRSERDATASLPAPDAGSDAHHAGSDTHDAAHAAEDAGTLPHCKRGLAYGRHTPIGLEALSPGVRWWYNWATEPEDVVAAQHRALGVEFVPMVWGGAFDQAQVTAELSSGPGYLLGFNEPNFKVQANMTAAEAAARWPALEAIADARGLALVSPALNYCGPAADCHATDPFVYLDAFFAACDGCRVDYLAAHWYACDGPALSWYLGELKKYGKPIWLTEFACGDGDEAARSLAGQKQYMEDAVAILEADDDVYRYAWFAEENAIANVNVLTADGQLSELGALYVSLPHHDPACAH